MASTRAGGNGGQASVELIALLPLLGVVALLAWQAVVAGQTWWLAGAAARDAARARAVGGDPVAAAHATLPGARVSEDAGGGIRISTPIPLVGLGSRSFGAATARARMEPQR
jgi:hypothetical protein